MRSNSKQYTSIDHWRDRQVDSEGLDVPRPAGMCGNGRRSATLLQHTLPQTEQSGGQEVPPAVSEEREQAVSSASASIFSEGLNSEGAVIVHGIPSSVSREVITSILSKFGSIQRVKHIKFPHSKKTRCLVDFFSRGVAKHLIQVGFIRYADKYLKVSDPKKIARIQAEPEPSCPGRDTICVWGPQGRTVIPRTEPRIGAVFRPGRERQRTERLAVCVEPEVDGSGLRSGSGGEARPGPTLMRPTEPNRGISGSTRSVQKEGDDSRTEMRDYEVHVDQDIVTTYRIKHRGVIYQQVVHSSNGWFMSSLAYPTQVSN